MGSLSTSRGRLPRLRLRLLRRRGRAARPRGCLRRVPVTALLAYLSPRRTDCLLFTGHADGFIAAHRLIESSPHGDDWLTLTAASSRFLVRGIDAAPVVHLEAHHAGRARYVLACDAGGRIRVFTENGTLYGTAIASSTPLAFVKQRLLFLTEAGAASLDLRSMSVREMPCEGLARRRGAGCCRGGRQAAEGPSVEGGAVVAARRRGRSYGKMRLLLETSR